MRTTTVGGKNLGNHGQVTVKEGFGALGKFTACISLGKGGTLGVKKNDTGRNTLLWKRGVERGSWSSQKCSSDSLWKEEGGYSGKEQGPRKRVVGGGGNAQGSGGY